MVVDLTSRINILGIVSTFVLICSLAAAILLEESEITFNPDGARISSDSDDINNITSRVAGSPGEELASTIISEMFIQAGMSNVQINEFEILGSWLEEPQEGEEETHMHAQVEQGIGNIPGLPDGSAGSGRIQLSSSGDLNHMTSFSFFGYSGGAHKHDSELIDVGTGDSDEFSDAGDLVDKAVLVQHNPTKTNRSFSDYYRDAIVSGASVLMVYEEGGRSPYYEPIVVQDDDGRIIPFPVAYPELDIIPFIFITEDTAEIFMDYIKEASGDDNKYAILDGNWGAARTGPRTVHVVTGEISGRSSSSVMIGSHHDTAYLSNGGKKDAAAVAQILEIARELKKHELENTVKFVSYGGEEIGLLSSQAYLESEGFPDDVMMYVNIDSAVFSTSSGLLELDIETSDPDIARISMDLASEVFGENEVYSATVSTHHDHEGEPRGCGSHRNFELYGIRSIGIGPGKHVSEPVGSESCSHYREYLESFYPNYDYDEEGLKLTPEFVLNLLVYTGAIGEGGPIVKIEGLEEGADSWLFPFTIALFAGLATGIGGLIVLVIKEISRELMAFMLGMEAGVMLLISILDLWLGQAKDFGFLLVSMSFIAGGAGIYVAGFYLGREDDLLEMSEERRLYKSGILTAVALGVHNFPEGLAIGVAVMESAQYGLVIMIAIGLHNIPEGIAVAAPIKAGNGGSLKAMAIAFATGLTEPLGAFFALIVLGSVLTPLMVALSLSFVGGIMAVVSLKELVPQAYSQNRTNYMVVGMIFGAALMQMSLLLLE